MGAGVPCKHAVVVIAMHRSGGYSPDDFVHKLLTMDAVRATYNYVVQPVPSEEFWNPTGCGRIELPPIVRLAGRPRHRRIKDHVDMIVGKRFRRHAKSLVQSVERQTTITKLAR
ncbi:hypothetical protein PIB30_091929, partial [Stylosanthes scabra]|nr:hypothetical protein [Stylosanthes scabra]